MCTSPGMQPLAARSAAACAWRLRQITARVSQLNELMTRLDRGDPSALLPGLGQTEKFMLRGTTTRRMPSSSIGHSMAATPGEHLSPSRQKLFRLILAYPPNLFAARLSIHHWTLIVRAEFIAAGSIAVGWT